MHYFLRLSIPLVIPHLLSVLDIHATFCIEAKISHSHDLTSLSSCVRPREHVLFQLTPSPGILLVSMPPNRYYQPVICKLFTRSSFVYQPLYFFDVVCPNF